ncbi:hypothetical protein B5S31_g4300 [[Candida] boidinii]|nr:hypothetical protein B5S31_g4300 [[Candida] boidinii]
MSESEPLLSNQQQQSQQQQQQQQSQQYQSDPYYDDDGYSIYSENTIRKKKLLKHLLSALGLLITIPIIYYLIIFLPNLAPPAADIPPLVKVDSIPIYLHPLHKPIKKDDFTQDELVDEEDNDEFDQFEDQFEDIDFINEAYPSKYSDGESPFKPIPDFDTYSYLDSTTKLFSKHVKDYGINLKKNKKSKRLILIGDIHGSLKPLHKLLNKINYNLKSSNDHIIMLGDFISKGKNSIGVLDWAIANNIDCVLGNHEIEVLKRYGQFHGLPKLTFKRKINSNDTDTDDVIDDYEYEIEEISINEQYDLDDEMRLAKQLSPEHIGYLSTCSLIKKLGPVPHLTNKKYTKYSKFPSNGIAVHGGLIWNVEHLYDQIPETVVSVRNLLPPDFTIPTEDPHIKGSEPWFFHWNLKQSKDVESLLNDTTTIKPPFVFGNKVYYGHDAKHGLKLKEYTTGLDSGCVYGGQLSAEIIWAEVEDKSRIQYKRLLAQVNC